ncbi:MAG: tetratricopeptide repeat protein [Thermoanaerobaculia bacterium]
MKTHPPDPILRRLLHSSEETLQPVREHVAECSRCSRRIASLHAQRPPESAYDAALTSGAKRLRDLQAFYEREREGATGLVAELLKHPAERRRILVRNHTRFHTWGVFERLLEKSRREGAQNSSLGEAHACLALDLSEYIDPATYGTEAIEDLRGRAWAYIGNARRVQSDLRGAQDALDRALMHLRRGTRDPWERAVWLDLKASLLRAQRRFDEAIRLLRRALVLFLAVGDRHRAGRTLVSMDVVFHHSGQPERGIPLLHRALDLIDPAQEPHLLVIAKHNLIDDLVESGRFMEAQRLLLKTRSLYGRFDEPWIQNKLVWVEGKIARGLGQTDRAEEIFQTAKARFLDMNSAYDVALVSLDLAGLYTEQGRTMELKQLAGEMVPIFASLQVQRETLAAFTLWQQAVQAETAGAELTARIANSLKRARYDQNTPGQNSI